VAEAVLRIKPEGGAEVARLLADVERLFEATQQRRERSGRASRQRQSRETEQHFSREQGHYRQSARVAQETDAHITRSRLRALALQGSEQERFNARLVKAYQDATRVFETETGKRTNLSVKEQRQVETLALAMVRTRERAERSITATVEREARKRAASARAIEGAINAGGQVAGAVHNATQAPRMEMAQIQATLASALGEGGATAGELGGLQARVMNFAEREGMDPATLARALQASQQQFSSLTGADPAARQAALDRALGAARLANDAQTNPEEVMRLSGALSGLGSQDTINAVLRSAIGISRRGGVELGLLSSQNLSTIQSQMAAAVANLRRENPNATEGAAQQVMVDAFVETLSELEVMAPRGLQGKSAGTAIRQLGSALHDPRVQGAFATRLQNEFGGNAAQRRAALDTFFANDANGRRVLRSEFLGAQGGENFGRALTTLVGGDPDRIRSLLGRGTRTGDRGEILHANQREMLAGLAGQDARGRTGWDALGVMRQGAGDVTDADLARTRAIVQSLDLTRTTRSHLRGMRNARDPSSVQSLSDRFADFAAEHPLLASLGQYGSGGGALATLYKNGPAARAAMARASSMGGTLSARASLLADLLRPGNAEGLSGRVGFQDDAAMIAAYNRAGGGARGRSAAREALTESQSSNSVRDVSASGQILRDAVREGIREGLRGANITATADSHLTAHADAVQATRPRTIP